MTSYLRPDEKAAKVDIEKSKNFDRSLKTGLKAVGTVATTAAGIGAASKMSTKLLPFLNEYIPKDLAMKGIAAISPGIAKMLKKGQENGLDLQSGLEYVKKEINKQTKPEKEKNIIQKYSPELFQEISDIVQSGGLPIRAASKVYNKYKDVIAKIQKDNKVDWLELVDSIFGQPQQTQDQQMQQPQQRQQPQQPQQGGNGNAMLLQAIQSINQRLGGQ